MTNLKFTGRQTADGGDILLQAELDGKHLSVRITQETLHDRGLLAGKDMAVAKAKERRFEPGGSITVRTTDFSGPGGLKPLTIEG